MLLNAHAFLLFLKNTIFANNVLRMFVYQYLSICFTLTTIPDSVTINKVG